MKKNTLTKLILAVVFALPLSLSAADDGGEDKKPEGKPDRAAMRRPEMPKFEDIDSDGNGEVSKKEWMDFHIKRAEERAKVMFGRIDKDGSDSLTKEEMPKPRAGGQGPGRGDGQRRKSGDGDGEGRKPKRPEAEA